jgi:hypothetical protein
LYKSLSADLDLSEQSEETSPESEDGLSPKENNDLLLPTAHARIKTKF